MLAIDCFFERLCNKMTQFKDIVKQLPYQAAEDLISDQWVNIINAN